MSATATTPSDRDLDQLLGRMEELLGGVDELDGETRDRVYELLDGVDALHRFALTRLSELVGDAEVARLRDADPAVAWLFDAYGIGVDVDDAAERALEDIRPYIHSHGGRVDVLDVTDGVVRVRLGGACAGCTASAVTLREGVEKALAEGVPGFAGLDVVEEEAESHPPPGPTLLQIETRPGARGG
jgi:Fe-S cluster biogenesis protein NfuA